MRLDGFTDITPILRAGVYALVYRSEVVYVGKSKSMYARIYAHRNLWNSRGSKTQRPAWLQAKGILFDEVHIRPCMLEQLDAIEAELIEAYRPRYNVALKPAGRPTTQATLRVGAVLISTIPTAPEPIMRRL